MKEISEKLARELYEMIQSAECESEKAVRNARAAFLAKAELHAINASIQASQARLHLLWHMDGHLQCESQAAPEQFMDWDLDVSDKTRKLMHELGCFSPTTRVSEGFVKGCLAGKYGESEEFYLDSKDLRDFAEAMLETAKFLDDRKAAEDVE